MKLVAISRVKNEIDIIEAFVRHHAQHFDKIVVLDDGSTDGTYEALTALQGAGLPLLLFREPRIGAEQGRYMTQLLRLAADRLGADWVAPIDADEFIEPPQGLRLAEVLPDRAERALSVDWNNFVWRPEDDEAAELNPVRRLKLRLPPQDPGLKKVIVPAGLAMAGEAELAEGNHGLFVDGVMAPNEPLAGVNLCHFPIRSVAQYATKVAFGYLQHRATPNWDRGQAFHYIDPFQRLMQGLDRLASGMEADSRRFSLAAYVPSGPEPVESPLRYDGGALSLMGRRQDPLTSVLQYADALAARYGALAEDEGELRAQLERLPQSEVAAAKRRLEEDNAVLTRRLGDLEAELTRLRETLYQRPAEPA